MASIEVPISEETWGVIQALMLLSVVMVPIYLGLNI